MLSERLPARAPWVDHAECQGLDEMPTADVCARCTVRPQCLSHALTEQISDGRWGGYTGEERDVLLQTHKGDVFDAVTSANRSGELRLMPTARQLAAARARHPSISEQTRAQLELDLRDTPDGS